MIERPALIAAIADAVAGLDDAKRRALSHHGWCQPDEVASDWREGAMLPADIVTAVRPGPLTEPGLIALGLAALLDRSDERHSSFSVPAVVAGNLTAPNGLSIRSTLLVLGDLTAGGVIGDCGPDSLVVVVGDCRARGLDTSGDFLVLGDLVIDEVVRGVYNDNSLVVAGDLRARFVDSNDHDITAIGEIIADHYFELGRRDDDAASMASGFLVDELVDTELWQIYWDAVFECVASGQTIFREVEREPIRPEPAKPTHSELEGIDLETVFAKSRRDLRRSDVAYADRESGELWLIRPAGWGVMIYDGSEFWSTKLGDRVGPDRRGKPADQRLTFWRKRGDLFAEVERFGADVFVHAGWNNCRHADRFGHFFADEAEATSAIEALRERWSRGFVEVSDRVPGRGVLEREFGSYEGETAYLSVCIRDNAFESSDGHRRPYPDIDSARRRLEEFIADKRRDGYILKTLEWKPFGRMG